MKTQLKKLSQINKNGTFEHSHTCFLGAGVIETDASYNQLIIFKKFFCQIATK